MNLRPWYRMYVDEVGNPSTAHLEHSQNRYFSLSGVIVELANEPTIAREMNTLKLKYFGSDAIIMHRNEIETYSGVFQALRDEHLKAEFIGELISLLQTWDYTVMTVAMDKESLSRKQALARQPYHQCLAALIPEYALFLNSKESRGDVMLEARGKGEDISLQAEFARMWQRTIKGITYRDVLTSKHPKIRPKSHNEIGLQFADLLAYPGHLNAMIKHGISMDTSQLSSLTAAVMQIINSKHLTLRGATIGEVFLA